MPQLAARSGSMAVQVLASRRQHWALAQFCGDMPFPCPSNILRRAAILHSAPHGRDDSVKDHYGDPFKIERFHGGALAGCTMAANQWFSAVDESDTLSGAHPFGTIPSQHHPRLRDARRPLKHQWNSQTAFQTSQLQFRIH